MIVNHYSQVNSLKIYVLSFPEYVLYYFYKHVVLAKFTLEISAHKLS